MGRTLCFGSLPGRLARSSFPRWSLKKKLSFWPYDKSFIDRACSGKIAGHYRLLFCVFVPGFVSVREKNARPQKHKRELGQYPDILTSRLVKNVYMLNEYHAFFSMLRDLYSTANDPQPQMIPRPQMIPKMDRK